MEEKKKFTVYNVEEDTYSTVEGPDSSFIYTYADYLNWNFEERLELFRGKIFRLAAPARYHQRILVNLTGLFYNALKNKQCQLYVAPFDVRLPVQGKKKDHEIITVVQPDVCVICDASKLDSRGCCGAPDLVIEILSPGNSKKERKLKYELYEEAGVLEYWIVSPEKQNVKVFILNKQSEYEPAVLYVGDDTIKATSVPGLAVSLNDIFTK